MGISKVFIIRGKGILNQHGDINKKKLAHMFSQGFSALTGGNNPGKCISLNFNIKDRIGIKINTLSGRMLSTRPEVSLSLANLLSDNNIQKKNIFIWDRTNHELRDVGYRLSIDKRSIKILGTDTQGVGYNPELISHLNVGSLFSKIQANFITASISLAVLKDHGLAGVTAGMKNYFGAIHNPNKYHDSNCNPYIAELFDTGLIRKKHKITILDALIVQYHRGPSYHAKWAEKYGAFIFSFDPVAADFAGWHVIEKLRARKGLPSLAEERREPVYLKTAERMGLGKANLNEVEIIENEV